MLAWSQSRVMLPGWYGTGTAFEEWIADGDGRMEVLQHLYRRWPFFRTVLSNMAQVLAKSDMGLAAHYSELVEDEALDTARDLMARAGDKLVIPVDAIVANEFSNDAASMTVDVEHVPEGWRILDVGPATMERFREVLAGAKTVVWNGPMGVFEFPTFAARTVSLARALAGLDATTIVGGGDSAAAIQQAGLTDKMTHISTGGGASLEMLEGKELPGLAALDDR